MDLWTPDMTRMIVSTAITILVPYLVFAAERYLKVRLDEAARATLDTAMRNGADWLIREGRLPTPAEVLRYVHRAAPDAVARWELDGLNQDIAADRAQAVIEQALQAAESSASPSLVGELSCRPRERTGQATFSSRELRHPSISIQAGTWSLAFSQPRTCRSTPPARSLAATGGLSSK